MKVLHSLVILSVIMCVVVTLGNFENVKDVLVHETTNFPCGATNDENIDWYYQQVCDDFQHGLYFCSSPTVIAIGHQFQVRTVAPGEHSLLISGITKNMTGLYTCKKSETQTVIDSVLLNVICKYYFQLLLHYFYLLA